MQKILGYMRKAIQNYRLITDGDRILVGVSGGKDSLVLLDGLVLLRRFIGIDYDVVAVTLDMGFTNDKMDFTPIVEHCEKLGVDLKDTIGFGDSMNDLEMIETVGYSVCMDNGSPKLKEISKLVCPAVEKDGLAWAFEKLGLV